MRSPTINVRQEIVSWTMVPVLRNPNKQVVSVRLRCGHEALILGKEMRSFLKKPTKRTKCHVCSRLRETQREAEAEYEKMLAGIGWLRRE